MINNIKQHTQIYVACPSQVATGGPELLHQLVYKLNKLGYNASMVYFDNWTLCKHKSLSRITRHKDPVHVYYHKYNNPVTLLYDIKDDSNNVIVIPETFSTILYMFKNIKKALWWLSVDNFFLKQKEKSYRLKNIFSLMKSYDFNDNPNIYHLSQSFYAIDFLKNKGVPESKISYLSDFLNKTFLDEMDQVQFDSSSRKDVILYNPKKGYETTSKLKSLLLDYEWVPLVNMTPDEVKNLLLSSKVYIDFGFHPGKDRFPREAAICGCCVITGTKGSAKFFEDVYILDKYKFDNPVESIEEFKIIIEQCFSNYNSISKDFEEYRNRILNEEEKFEKDIINVF